MFMKPILKYGGGKYKEIEKFSKYIPSSFDTYYEPFVGGGATFFHLAPPKAVIGDVNHPLIHFYRELKENFNEVVTEIKEIADKFEENQKIFNNLKDYHQEKRTHNPNEDLYYDLRDQFNGLKERRYSLASLYYFINKTAFSGMIRYNKEGHFNVPFGHYKHFSNKSITFQHHLLLTHTQIIQCDYTASFKMAGENDFMFLDPPYDCVFTNYGNMKTVGDFGEEQHRQLAEDFKKLRCKALLIISDTPLIQELYQGYIKESYNKNYAVNIRNRFKASAKHLIITNY